MVFSGRAHGRLCLAAASVQVVGVVVGEALRCLLHYLVRWQLP